MHKEKHYISITLSKLTPERSPPKLLSHRTSKHLGFNIIHDCSSEMLVHEELCFKRTCAEKDAPIIIYVVTSSQGYCFSSSHVWMVELDYKEN